jgi:hypothetical protein
VIDALTQRLVPGSHDLSRGPDGTDIGIRMR